MPRPKSRFRRRLDAIRAIVLNPHVRLSDADTARACAVIADWGDGADLRMLPDGPCIVLPLWHPGRGSLTH
jgi:hypothetical protein